MEWPLPPVLTLGTAFIAGMALGLLHFKTLHRVTDNYLAGQTGRAIALQFLRLGVLFGFLAVLVVSGAAALLSGTAGVLLGRLAVLRFAEFDK